MNISREDAQQILDALYDDDDGIAAAKILRSRLAEGEQEHIGRLVVNKYGDSGIGVEFTIDTPEEILSVGQLVYTAPQGAPK